MKTLNIAVASIAIALTGCSTLPPQEFNENHVTVVSKQVSKVRLEAAYDNDTGDFVAWVGYHYFVGNHPDLMEIYKEAVHELSKSKPCGSKGFAYIAGSMFEDAKVLWCRDEKVNLGYHRYKPASAYITGATAVVKQGKLYSVPTAGYSKASSTYVEVMVNIDDIPKVASAVKEMEANNIHD